MENKEKISKEDLNTMAVDLLDLKFNRSGFNLVCEYLEKKLKEDGVKIEINQLEQFGIFNDIKFDYSTQSKREGIKEMVSQIIVSGEKRHLTGEDTLGTWLNHAVEFMTRRILEKMEDSIIKVIEGKKSGLWTLFCKGTEQNLLNLNAVDIYKVDEMYDRIIRNIKRIKFAEFTRLNKFVW